METGLLSRLIVAPREFLGGVLQRSCTIIRLYRVLFREKARERGGGGESVEKKQQTGAVCHVPFRDLVFN